MPSQADIYADLVTKAHAVAASLSLPASIDDENFEAPIDGNGMILPYLRFDMFNNAPFWEGLRDGVIDQGLSQVMIVMPRPHDREAGYAYFDQIRALYPKASRLPGNAGVKVQEVPWVATPIVEPDRTSYPVTIPWVA
jgi:hypothetical protein